MEIFGKEYMSINEFVLTELKNHCLTGFYCDSIDCESVLQYKDDLVFYKNKKAYCYYCIREFIEKI
jgi:hypothetical protein